MYDIEARHIIEALRSGIPSRAVGQYFSEARPKIMKEICDRLDMVCEQGKSKGRNDYHWKIWRRKNTPSKYRF